MKVACSLAVGVSMILFTRFDSCDAGPLIPRGLPGLEIAGRTAQLGTRITLGKFSFESFWKALEIEREEEMEEMDLYGHQFTRPSPDSSNPSPTPSN
ncbi:hypothetical protein PGT21_030775 [Puccinia graminis f. sp. tritici]|uniref:Uncharacterized protein n=2 Tax=Puccinia graminis f. sp. tritici TaxID=56615 RepID=E3L402_PUCGT|nr:uncharacterized protein PGTG_17134 [Puccinia graminis f. sp. tritici CRL 75-36-700-3]EFP91277.2 hypothetical protein PGTG_17134 [Puccinia graminis f. sp. tritici CRL 75-36-700-3]KAA1075186.1 hypothetical protein PGT21_030775 [Puccinia graminis f. sp. tritici]